MQTCFAKCCHEDQITDFEVRGQNHLTPVRPRYVKTLSQLL